MSNEEIRFIFCTECGAKNDSDANFCISCGAKLVKPVESAEPVVIPVTEEPQAEEETPEEVIVTEEPAEEVAEPEVPAVEEVADEEQSEEALAPAVIPEAEEPREEPVEEDNTEEEPSLEEPEEDEAVPVVIPVVIPEAEEPEPQKEPPKEEEPAKEEPKAEPVAPVVVPAAPKVSKKEAKLEKKLEEAKKQAQEQARKQAEKEAEKAKKAEEKAEKAEEKARKAEEKAKKSEKSANKPEQSKSEDYKVQNNSNYYYITDNDTASKQISEKPKKKHRQNFFLKMLSFLLAVILMASLAVAVPITLLNLFLTDHNIDVIVDRALSGIELDKIEFSTADGTKTLSGALHDITNEFEGWDHITEEQISDALLEDFVKQFVTDALAKLGMTLKEGEAMLGWTPEQIYDFIEANRDIIEKLAREAGYEGKLPIEEKKDMIIENIENRIGEDGISASALFGGSEETEELARYLEMAQALFSVNTLYLAWALVAFIAILILFTNLGYFGAFCRACGFPAFLVGAIYFLAGLGVSPILSIVNLPIPIFATAVEFTAGFLGAMLMDISLIVVGVGLVLIIISYISDAIRRKTDSKKNA